MSTLRVDSITSRVGGSAPSFPNGVTVTGIVTATAFYGSAVGLTNIPAAGNSADYANNAGISTVTNGFSAGMNAITVGVITAAQFVSTGTTGYSGIWSGSNIKAVYGGTGISTYVTGDILYSSATNTLSRLPIGSAGQVLTVASGSPSWAAASGGGGSGSGLGLFNTGITGSAFYTITNSMAAGLTLPATAGYKYIIHSIQISNIDGNSNTIDVTGDITGTSYSDINFASTIPVPGGSGVELLKKPKVLNPSNVIRFSGSSNGSLTAFISYEATTDTNYFGQGVSLTDTSVTDLYTASGNAVIESLLVCNTHGTSDAKLTFTITDGSNSLAGYVCSNIIVPADSSIEILENIKYIPSGYKVRALANVGNRLEVMISGKVKT